MSREAHRDQAGRGKVKAQCSFSYVGQAERSEIIIAERNKQQCSFSYVA